MSPPTGRVCIDRQRPHPDLNTNHLGDHSAMKGRSRSLAIHLPWIKNRIVIVPRCFLRLPAKPPQMSKSNLRSFLIDFKKKIAGRIFLPPAIKSLGAQPLVCLLRFPDFFYAVGANFFRIGLPLANQIEVPRIPGMPEAEVIQPRLPQSIAMFAKRASRLNATDMAMATPAHNRFRAFLRVKKRSVHF